MVKPIKPDQTV